MGNSAIELPRAPSGKAEKKVGRQPPASAGPAEMASVSRALSGLAEHGLVRAGRKWTRDKRRALADRVRQNHYAGSVPSGKSFYFEFEDAIVVYSIPANRIAQGLLGKPNAVLELARLWAIWLRGSHPAEAGAVTDLLPVVPHFEIGSSIMYFVGPSSAPDAVV